jgi:hypothetical protein
MLIIGCDLHTRYQQIVMLDKETGEVVEHRLEHEGGETPAFYQPALRGCRGDLKQPPRPTGSNEC